MTAETRPDSSDPNDAVDTNAATSLRDTEGPRRHRGSDDGADGPPSQLRKQFVIENKLGEGGMGSVYRALDLQRRKYDDPRPYVALKILNADVLRDYPDAALALQREASRAMELSHPNIVRIYGFYDLDPDDRQCFITMELLEGKPLDQLLKSHPRGLTTRHAFYLLEGICAGLQYAHDRRLVHSDLKPNNLFLTNDGGVRILDFGIATPLRDLTDRREDTRYNPRQLGVLTPAYASLEQWDRLPADPRDDVYSLACIAYEMICSRHPYNRADARKALADGLTPAPIRSLTRPQNAALARALSLKRADRTATVEQFHAELTEGTRKTRNSVAVIGSAASAALIMAALGATLLLPASPTGEQAPGAASERSSEPSPVAAPSLLDATVVPTTAQEFRERCGTPANIAALDALLERGLAAETMLALGGDTDARRADASTLTTVLACIRELADLGFRSPEGDQWMLDAEATLKAASP